jgi:hypothetical protein
VPESSLQQHGTVLLRSLGASVYVIGTRRPKGDYQGTRQTPGIPDVYAVLPPPLLNAAQTSAVALWWEVKAQGGRLRPEQATFEINSRRANVAHVVGGVDELIQWLVAGGWLKADNVAWYRRKEASA